MSADDEKDPLWIELDQQSTLLQEAGALIVSVAGTPDMEEMTSYALFGIKRLLDQVSDNLAGMIEPIRAVAQGPRPVAAKLVRRRKRGAK